MNCHRFTPPQKGEAKEYPPTQWGGTPSPPMGGSTYPPMGGTNNKIINNKIINNKTIKTKTSFAFYTGKSTNVAFPGRCFNIKGGRIMKMKDMFKYYIIRIDIDTRNCSFFAFVTEKEASEFIITDGSVMNTEETHFKYFYQFVSGDSEISDSSGWDENA